VDRKKYESQCHACKIRTELSSYPLTYASAAVSRGIAGGSEGVMPYRVNPLVSAAFIGSLAAAMLLCPNWTARAAGECISKPDREVNQAGHWYYYVDRVNHRRCWFFETSRATVSPPSSADRVPAPNTDSQQSWFSRFASDVAKTFWAEPQQTSISSFSSEPQQTSMPDNSSTATKLTSPKHSRTSKMANRERPQIEPPPATNGVASTERQDQLTQQGNTEKNEKRSPQLSDADRQALFDDFLKWYRDRSIFGNREH
jgi:hypothetical protein